MKIRVPLIVASPRVVGNLAAHRDRPSSGTSSWPTRVATAYVLAALPLLGCESGPSKECQNADKAKAKVKKVVAAALAEQGIDEPPMVKGQPNPKAFDKAGNLKGGDRTQLRLAMGDYDNWSDKCDKSK